MVLIGKMKKKTITTISFLAIFLCVLLSACGTDNIDISGYADSEIVLAGISEDDEVVTIAELKELDCVTKKTHSTSDKIGEVKATGPTLETLLASKGIDISSVKKITFHGADGYKYALLADYIAEHDIILAFGIDGEPLDEESVPCRVIIPESDSAYWVRMLNRLDFELK